MSALLMVSTWRGYGLNWETSPQLSANPQDSTVRQSSRLELLEDGFTYFWESKLFNLSRLLIKRRKRAFLDLERLASMPQEKNNEHSLAPLFCSSFNKADVAEAFIARQTRSLNHLKGGSGQRYADQVKKGITKARKRLLELADEGVVANNFDFGSSNSFQSDRLLLKKTQTELKLVNEEIMRVKCFLQRTVALLEKIDFPLSHYIFTNLRAKTMHSLSPEL
jgi:hypothetical protein